MNIVDFFSSKWLWLSRKIKYTNRKWFCGKSKCSRCDPPLIGPKERFCSVECCINHYDVFPNEYGKQKLH